MYARKISGMLIGLLSHFLLIEKTEIMTVFYKVIASLLRSFAPSVAAPVAALPQLREDLHGLLAIFGLNQLPRYPPFSAHKNLVGKG